ncbi:GNAT family N-acetyltransferase [Streptomyces sp. YC537]|uniref:GNAT family N-acetyltransferase n=1 Tax=Streptomyces boluensis TaxID=1775135 RepID=A0A964V302_9ACTN|nr:N-acetyltransferase [Streptomyces boluensis]NBE56235.1 GNAT family N-acetyltransferase [Streptomyces boluensis]
MTVRDAEERDWDRIWPFWQRIVAAGETYSWDRDTPKDAARALWMPPGARVFVAVDDTEPDTVLGSASVKRNYGGPAAHIANAAFMVDPDRTGRGVGRRLAEHVLEQAARDGYEAMVFNAVVETNPALALWRSLGFTVVGTVPDAFDHPVRGRVALHIMHRRL